jgi:hypothetical protein
MEERSLSRTIQILALVVCSGLFLVCFVTTMNAQTMRTEAEKQLARDIYKEFIEIQSGYTDGSDHTCRRSRAVESGWIF